MTPRPEVSVVVPTRNRRSLLTRGLSSVLGQVDVELELLVVDEGSSDGTREQVAALDEGRIRYLRNDRPLGVANARNRGVAEARGDWIAFLDDDDLWAPTKLRSQLERCAERSAGLSYTALVTVDAQLSSRVVSPAPPESTVQRDLLGTNVIGAPSSVLVRRSLLDQVGGFDATFSVLADWDLWLRLAAAGRPAACNAPLTGYTRHRANMHLDVEGSLEEFRRLRAKHAALARSQGRRIGDERWWGWVASALRRSGHRFRSAAMFLWVGVRFGKPRAVRRAAEVLVGPRAAPAPADSLPEVRADLGAASTATDWLDAFALPADRRARG